MKSLELQLKLLAMDISPFKTGNAMRSIRSKSGSNFINLSYDLNQANYIEYLEEGTRNSNKHVGYISQDTTYAIYKYLSDIYNNRRSSETINFKTLATKSANNPAKQLILLRSVGERNGI